MIAGAILWLMLGATPPISLGVEAPEALGCPTIADLQDRVRATLGQDPFDDAASRRMTVVVSTEGSGLRADLRLREGERLVGERTLRAPSPACDDLFAAVALNLVLLAEPARALEPAPAPEPTRAPPPRPRPPEQAPIGLETWAGVGASLGVSPGIAPVITVGAGYERPTWSVGLETRYDLPRDRDFGGGAVRADLLGGAALGCLRWLRFGACASVAAGAQRTAGDGFEQVRHTRTPFVAAGVRGTVAWQLAPGWRLRVWGDGWAPLSRTTLRIDGEIAWESPPVAGDLGLSVGRGF